MDKHRHVAVEVRDLAVPPFKGQFVGDVGYASGKHRQMTLRHNTVSPVEPTELRPAPGSFLNPIERVTYRPSRTPSFAQPIDANRYFDAPSLQPEGRRSGGLKLSTSLKKRHHATLRAPICSAAQRIDPVGQCRGFAERVWRRGDGKRRFARG